MASTALRRSALLLLPLFAACGDDPAPSDAGSDVAPDTLDVTDDVDAADTATDGSGDSGLDVGDDTADADTDAADGSGGGERAIVPIDLAPYVDQIPDPTGTARAFCTTSADELIRGELIDGIVGDCIIENDDVRFLVAMGSNVISPCSYDGNIVDAELRNSPDWAVTGDVMGEICLLLNVGQTLVPERIEILADGSDGYAVMAVTGTPGILDFLNIKQMVEDYAPGLISEFPIDPDRIVPSTITVYYILRPGDRGVRVVTALRNDGEATEYVVAAHMIMSGSTGGYFNPLSGTGGFGTRDFGLDSLDSPPVPFVAYQAEHAAYAYVPAPDPTLTAELPVGAAQFSIAGVAVGFFGSLNLLELVLTPPALVPRTPGFRAVEPGGVTSWEHWTFVGDGSLSTMVDSIWDTIGVDTGTLRGTLVDHAGAPVVRGTVSAVDSRNRMINQVRTGADGSWALDVPAGTYTLRARQGALTARSEATAVTADAVVDVPALALTQGGMLHVSVQTPDGEPTPARITVACEGTCPSRPDNRETNMSLQPPNGWERIVSVGVDGIADIDLAPGTYRVFVSRGLEYSVWPEGGFTSGGQLVTIGAGDNLTLDAEIARVVDTSGVLSGDFHIHAMASSDSDVSNLRRVLDFLGEGVDVMVSTDHDVITDFAPTIAALGAQGAIASLIGSEITTPNIGHFNAFPLTRDESKRRGGPLDWSNGEAPNLTPGQLYAALTSDVIERVIQVNHPSGTFGALMADVLTGQTFAERARLRMPPGETDPVTGDTGLWSDGFTALEVMNGHSRDSFWSYFRWWLGMVSRGFTPTATAVTDTHGLYSDLGGSPRSFVFVGDNDSISPLDGQAFVRAINEGRLIGTNGPFFRVELQNDAGQVVSIGDTVATGGQDLTLRVTVETPEWMRVDTVDIYLNATDDLLGAPGEQVTRPHPATLSLPIEWEEGDLEVVATGAIEHRRWRRTVETTITADADAWLVVLVRDASADQTMFPVVGNRGARALAFANPVYIDADGGGYNNPPLADEAAARAAMPRETKQAPTPWPAGMRPTPQLIGELIEASRCAHDHGAIGHVHAPVVPSNTPSLPTRVPTHTHPHTHGHTHGHSHPH